MEIFMLSLLSKKFSSNNIGLYRDDGLLVFRNINGRQAEKKTIQKIFKDKGLQIIIKYNLKIIDYLGVTINLNDGTYRPFHKPNEETTYIHVESDHPPLWFSPPYSKSVKTNIGKLFLRLINKHFPPKHKYRKIFSRNTIKISYLYMPNIKSKISTHKKILNKPVNQNTRKCNCINENTSHLNGNCLLENNLYIAALKSDKKNYQPRNYKGINENGINELELNLELKNPKLIWIPLES